MIVHIIEEVDRVDMIDVLSLSPTQLTRLLLDDIKKEDTNKYNFVISNGRNFKNRIIHDDGTNTYTIYLGCEFDIEQEIFYELSYK